jgi:tRNA 2-thiocytidine biosynthesis protein TtcA
MKANYTIEAGDVRVIRPLVYVREKSTRDFSNEAHLPVINENCPACFEEPKVRRVEFRPSNIPRKLL